MLGKCKDVRNISEYFGLFLYIYEESNRSCQEFICIFFTLVKSHVLSHVMSESESHVMSQSKSHVMSQSKSHVKSHSCKSHS